MPCEPEITIKIMSMIKSRPALGAISAMRHQNTYGCHPGSLLGGLLIILIRLYQATISPWLGNCCRFYPSCSNYCITAIRKRGWLPGLYRGGARLLKGHQFHSGGVDSVP